MDAVKRTGCCAVELRRRPRLPVPVQLLHHHQCAGAQVALPPRRRRRGASSARTWRRASRFFITDDNFARNQNWEAIFDRLIAMREARKASVHIVAAGRHRLSTRSAASSRRPRAPGVNRVFIGLENINPDNLKGAQKGQNQIAEYREMLQAWRARV